MSAVSAPKETMPVEKQSPWMRLVAIQRRFQVVQILALVALFEWGTWTVTDFATKQSVYSMLITASFLGLAGAGQTIVVLVGGIDLSIPAFISLGAIVISDLPGLYHWAFVPALVVIIVVSVLLGGVNGYISHRFRVPPLVVTLGMASIITGALLVWTNGKPSGTPPGFLTNLTSVTGTTFGIGFPPVVIIWAVVAVVLGVILRRTLAGRHVYATGANPIAADLALVNTRRVWVGAFAASALIAGLLGILLGGYAGSGNVQLGDPYVFEGLAAVIVGGTAFGARGDYWRTVLGALVLTVLSTVLVGKGYSNADQQIIFGVLILVVVAGYGREARLRDRI
ncbi:MAG: ABC transporter permease [Solirubrobacterales bacterium]|nr:ABC transporter permease [Solirubrobacterales bacterium]